jgi:hypothetical protein
MICQTTAECGYHHADYNRKRQHQPDTRLLDRGDMSDTPHTPQWSADWAEGWHAQEICSCGRYFQADGYTQDMAVSEAKRQLQMHLDNPDALDNQ